MILRGISPILDKYFLVDTKDGVMFCNICKTKVKRSKCKCTKKQSQDNTMNMLYEIFTKPPKEKE